MKNIEELVNKYFDGETTCEEERELRRFFAQERVPEHLKAYGPFFAFFEEEKRKPATKEEENPLQQKKKNTFRNRLMYATGGIAATLLLLVGIAGIHRHFNALPDSYVIIDGKCYTDENLAREQALAAFRNVSMDEDELLDSLFQ